MVFFFFLIFLGIVSFIWALISLRGEMRGHAKELGRRKKEHIIFNAHKLGKKT